MGVALYTDHIFPFLMDWSMWNLDGLRTETLAPAEGEVLEIGFGTGRNLRHYPRAVRRLTAMDPLDALRRRVRRRIARAPFPVERIFRAADGKLPFEENQFDCVVTTRTICTVDNPVEVLQAMRRVLRPDGLYLFLEHGLSDDPRVARFQRWLSPLQRRVAAGCDVDRPIDHLIRSAGFRIERLERFDFRREPGISGHMYRGIARP
jgi:ubiquinone/menaquinone biosynthesis C-methylase UbiE